MSASLRVQVGSFATARAAVPAIFAAEGLGGLYSGFGVTVVREIPFSAIQFPLYEAMKAKWATAQVRDALTRRSPLHLYLTPVALVLLCSAARLGRVSRRWPRGSRRRAEVRPGEWPQLSRAPSML